jgi:serine/threonine protein kinase/class 3 adenylate cyclase/Leucine-rich repeat (LRR) protein
MDETIQELRTEIERLQQELKGRSKTPTSVATSIEVDTFAMRIGPDELILQLNTAFAKHLGISNKAEIIGQKAEVLRRYLDHELLMAIVRPEEGGSLVRMANDGHGRVFEVKTTLHNDMLDVVMKDVTNEQQFRSLVQRYVLKDFDSLSEEDLRTFKFPERRFMTVSFTDLRGFTALTERLGAEEVRAMLNAYFEEVIRVVETNEATVAQLIGDALMAFYGAPQYFKDHALRAIKTACEQIEKVDELCARYAHSGKEMCRCGVGINSGDVVLGNMGGAGRQAYTVLGAAVNLASRLCGAAHEGQVLLTEVVLNAALGALPSSWEVIESRSFIGEDAVFSGSGGKVEGVHPLPDRLKGKVISIGERIKSQKKPAEFTFRYLYVLKVKGIEKELPVITVERAKHIRKSHFLGDQRAASQQSEVVIGKYKVFELIGEGGMGKVWKARDQFSNTVAIKMLTAGQGASAHQLQRFKREASVMAKLSHHNICRIHEIGEAEGATFIAMEYIDGVSLGEIIRHKVETGTGRHRSSAGKGSGLSDLVASIKNEKKTSSASASGQRVEPSAKTGGNPAGVSSVLILPTQQILAVMSKTCQAIQFAHEHGVLHRDLKPENIMIRPDGDPVVMDFGLAKLEERQREMSISIEGQIVGTIEYMAPEQAKSSKHVTERADVYSLGAILYQLLTGRKHFESSGNILQDAQKLQEYESPPLRQFNKEIDRELETIVLKALRPEPNQRYSSVGQMMEDIKRYQAGDPISAHAPTISYRLAKRIRKNRVAFSFSALLLLLAFAFCGYYYQQWRKQWGGWIREFPSRELPVNFSEAPPPGPAQAQWLQERFEFQNAAASAPVEPWKVRNGAMIMRRHQWCWLKDVHIRGDVKVFVEMRFTGTPEAFQICINAKKKLRDWKHHPPGYSCRFGIWAGSLDLITRDEVDGQDDFNSLVVSATPQLFAQAQRDAGNASASPESSRPFSLTFERRGERVSLQVDGKEVHHETYLMPLLVESGAQHGWEQPYENIGLRTWAKDGDVEIRSIYAFRFKLPESASPTVAGDSLVERGHLAEAIDKYSTIASDYQGVSIPISTIALTKAFLLAVHREDAGRRSSLHKELHNQRQPPWWHPVQKREINKYLQRVREVETLALWREGNRRAALKEFPAIFESNPDTRIALECLQSEHGPLEPDVSEEFLGWIAKTSKLAGLDISSLGLESLGAIKGRDSLRGLDCHDNLLTSLEPLRGMNQLRALYCQQNEIQSLDSIRDLDLFELYCNANQIESLEPLRGMPLKTLYCNDNRISDLSPLEGKPLNALDCSQNRIRSLDPVASLSSLSELYCASNQLTTIEPLRKLKALVYLDCSENEIKSLEPLQELRQNLLQNNLDLYALNCSGNQLVTLEPFVENPPSTFLFDCKTLPDAEIERASAVWAAKGLKVHANYARLMLALRHGDFQKAKSLASEFGGHSYLYLQQPLSAQEAEQFCAKLGGHLVTITGEEENAFLKEVVPAETSCRIGMVVSDAKPRWLTGEAVGFVPKLTDFRPSDRAVTWKNGAWLPLSAQEDKAMPAIIEWE